MKIIMRKMKMYRIAGIALLMAVTFTACLDDSEPVFDIKGDVFVTKKKVNDEIKYAPNYYVYGNVGMNSATVTLPNGEGTVNLDGSSGGLTYYKEPAESDFSTEMPAEGNYLFQAVSSKDESMQIGDDLQLNDLPFAELDTIVFQNSSTMQVSWNSVSGADGYFLKILDASENDVFLSVSLSGNTTDFTVVDGDETIGNWDHSITLGQTYTLQIHSFSYEANVTQSNIAYNIEEVSIEESSFTWE